MKEIVINICFGGFSLSREGIARLAELQGRECYFFTTDFKADASGERYVPASDKREGRDLFWTAFDVPNPNEVLGNMDGATWRAMSQEEKEVHNTLFDKHSINPRDIDRSDSLLVQVVKELGEKANGGCAELRIVEIPDDVEWEISEYDGNEHIAEKHRTWA